MQKIDVTIKNPRATKTLNTIILIICDYLALKAKLHMPVFSI